MQFSQLGLSDAIMRAAASEGYSVATPIQAKAIPLVIEGKDVLGSAQTGTGKTAAFAMPILHRLAEKPANGRRARCLVLAPTRELAAQIADSFRTYGKNVPLKYSIIYGGVNQNPQVDALRRGVDVIIATPGRLLDLYQQRHVDLSGIEILVLDEADRMLDMGFINDIRTIVAELPAKRQTMLFSATMPREIRKLAESLLKNPVTVQIAVAQSTRGEIAESAYMVDRHNKPQLLAHLVNALPIARGIVFTRTKHGADRVVRHLHTRGIRAEAIHGNKSQNARQRALDNFKIGKVPILVATDIASRGIDVDDVTHVINYDVTHEPETYVHRIGRTGRAGASGAAVSLVDKEEAGNLRAIERLIGHKIEVSTDQPVYKAGEKSSERHEHAPAEHQDRKREGHREGGSRRNDARGDGRRSSPTHAPARHAPAAAKAHVRHHDNVDGNSIDYRPPVAPPKRVGYRNRPAFAGSGGARPSAPRQGGPRQASAGHDGNRASAGGSGTASPGHSEKGNRAHAPSRPHAPARSHAPARHPLHTKNR